MPRFKVAHIREQGVDLIIIPLAEDFDQQSLTDQKKAISQLQSHARSAGLAGTVVPVWLSGDKMKFIAPPNWHSYFQSINMSFIWTNVNKEIFW